MKKINILLTSPSIDINTNVSGIANLTRLWIENNKNVNYILFESGKKDTTNRNIFWIVKQPFILVRYITFLLKHKSSIDLYHINMPMGKYSIIRESVFVFILSFFSKKILLHIRGGFYSNNKSIPKLLRVFMNLALNRVQQLIVLGEKEKSFFNDFYNIPLAKITSLPNCVKTSSDRTEKKLESNYFSILFIGRIDKNKGLLEIINGLINVPNSINFKLIIAGDGPDREWFINKCLHHFGNKTKYCGVVSGEFKEKLYQNAHIFLLPSYFEGLPNAMLEAMSYGVVPVVSPVGSIPEVVIHEQNGLLIPRRDSNSITKALVELTDNINLYQKYSYSSIKTINDKYSHITYLDRMNSIYNNMLK